MGQIALRTPKHCPIRECIRLSDRSDLDRENKYNSAGKKPAHDYLDEKVVAQLDAFVIVVLRSRSHTGQLNKEAEVELLDYYGCCASCG